MRNRSVKWFAGDQLLAEGEFPICWKGNLAYFPRSLSFLCTKCGKCYGRMEVQGETYIGIHSVCLEHRDTAGSWQHPGSLLYLWPGQEHLWQHLPKTLLLFEAVLLNQRGKYDNT